MDESHLRVWQREALEAWRGSGHRGIVQAVTGTGKTKVGYEAAFEAISDGFRVVVTVPTLELADQWAEQLQQLPLVRVGRWSGASRASLSDHEVIISTIQSAARRATNGQLAEQMTGRHGLLIADECHRDAAETFSKSLDSVFTRRLGLTATLDRPDGRHEELLVPYFGGIVYQIDHQEAKAHGIVAEHLLVWVGFDLTPRERSGYADLTLRIHEVWAHLKRSIAPDPKQVLSVQTVVTLAESGTDLLSESARLWQTLTRMRQKVLENSTSRFDAALKLDIAISAHQPSIVFTQSKAVARALKDGYDRSEFDVRSYVVDSDESMKDRRITMALFRNGTYNTLIAPRVLDEGIDVPAASLALVVSGTRSARQMTQRLGRVLRKKTSGRPAVLLVLYASGTIEDPQDNEQLHMKHVVESAVSVGVAETVEELTSLFSRPTDEDASDSDLAEDPRV